MVFIIAFKKQLQRQLGIIMLPSIYVECTVYFYAVFLDFGPLKGEDITVILSNMGIEVCCTVITTAFGRGHGY